MEAYKRDGLMRDLANVKGFSKASFYSMAYTHRLSGADAKAILEDLLARNILSQIGRDFVINGFDDSLPRGQALAAYIRALKPDTSEYIAKLALTEFGFTEGEIVTALQLVKCAGSWSGINEPRPDDLPYPIPEMQNTIAYRKRDPASLLEDILWPDSVVTSAYIYSEMQKMFRMSNVVIKRAIEELVAKDLLIPDGHKTWRVSPEIAKVQMGMHTQDNDSQITVLT